MKRSAAHQRIKHLRWPITKLLVRPFFADGKRIKEFESAADATAVSCLIIPQIDTDFFSELGKLHQPVEISNAVTPRFSASKFKRLAAVWFDLQCDPFLFDRFQNAFSEFCFPEKQGERRGLNVVIGA